MHNYWIETSQLLFALLVLIKKVLPTLNPHLQFGIDGNSLFFFEMLVTLTVKLLLYLPKKNVCFLGYELGADGRTCVDVDECDFLNGGCDQVSFLGLQTTIFNKLEV